MKFRGKVAKWLYALMVVINGGLIAAVIVFGFVAQDGIAAVIDGTALLGVDLLLIPMMVRNDVILEEDRLRIKVGWLKTELLYREITDIRKTRNLLASAALSLDRVYIAGKNEDVMISVQERDKLISELKRRCALDSDE